MKVVWASDAWEQYLEWQRTDFDVAKKINELIEDARVRFKVLASPSRATDHCRDGVPSHHWRTQAGVSGFWER